MTGGTAMASLVQAVLPTGYRYLARPAGVAGSDQRSQHRLGAGGLDLTGLLLDIE